MNPNTTVGKVLARVARRAVGIGLLLYLVDMNSTHVRDYVSSLVRSWRESETLQEMSAIANALDAEHISLRRYPAPDELADFIRQWIPATKGRDPSVDQWGMAFQREPETVGYVLRSCGPDGTCGTEDDIERRGGGTLE